MRVSTCIMSHPLLCSCSLEIAGQDISLGFWNAKSLYPVFIFLSLNSKVMQFVENSERMKLILIIHITT